MAALAHSPRIHWDDLRVVLAVTEAGAFAAAGRALKLDATTVQRRIDALEGRLGVRLFERLAAGHVATAAGERVIETARAAEDTIAALDRRLAGLDPGLEGRLRVTTTDTLSASVLPGYLRRLRDLHPRLGIDLVPANSLFTLARRDADVAVRPVATAPEGLVSRAATPVAFAIYGAAAEVAREPDRPPAERAWVAPDSSLSGIAADRWIAAHVRPALVAGRASTMTALAAMAAAGLGLTVLPCYLGDVIPGLARAAPDLLAGLETTLFLVTHPDLAASPKVATFLDVMEAQIAGDRALFEGRRPHRLSMRTVA